MSFSSDELSGITSQEWMEVFLAVTIVAVSTGFLIARGIGISTSVPLSVIFYGVVPGSMLVILFITLKVARTIYKQEDMSSYEMLPAGVMAMLLGVVAVNIGFITVLSGSTVLTGSMGTLKVSLLLVVLSMALSLSVLSREMTEIA